MRIPSASVDRLIYFVAVDSADLKTRKTALTSFTVYRSRNGGAATVYTTPTVAELSAANMPGVYSLTIDEDTTLAAGHDTEEYCIHITQASMAPVTRTLELYRPETTEGTTLLVSSGALGTGAIVAASFAANAIDANAIADNAIDAGAIAANAITSAKIATDAIGAAQIAANAITSSELADGAITAAKIADGAIDAATFASGAIDATAFAQGAADKVWLSATRTLTALSTALALSVWDVLTSAIATASSIGKLLKDDIDVVLSSGIQARLPTTLVGGRIDASVGAMAAGTVTAAAIATDAIDADAIAADAVTELRSLVSGTSDSGTTTTMVDAARTEADTDYWKGCWVLFTSGNILGQVRQITGFNAATDTITFAPATTQAVATQNYEILPAGAVDLRLWNGTVPNNLVSSRVDASVGAVAANAIDASAIATDAIGSAEFSQGAADKVWATATRLLTAGTNIALAKGVGLTGLNDIAASAIIDDATPFHGASVAAIKTKTDNLPTDPADESLIEAAITAGVNSILADTDDIQTRLPTGLVGGRMDSSVGAMAANTLTASALAADAVDEILDDPIEGSLTLRQAVRIILAALAGKSTGGSTLNVAFRDQAGSKDRIAATLDADDNRTAVVVDGT